MFKKEIAALQTRDGYIVTPLPELGHLSVANGIIHVEGMTYRIVFLEPIEEHEHWAYIRNDTTTIYLMLFEAIGVVRRLLIHELLHAYHYVAIQKAYPASDEVGIGVLVNYSLWLLETGGGQINSVLEAARGTSSVSEDLS